MSADAWKRDDKVRLASEQKIMVVLGYDTVGSVICRPLDDDRHGGLHVPPSSLVAATED